MGIAGQPLQVGNLFGEHTGHLMMYRKCGPHLHDMEIRCADCNCTMLKQKVI